MANNIYSSYYWLENNEAWSRQKPEDMYIEKGSLFEKMGLVIDVSLADYIVDDLNEKLSYQ